MITYDKLWETMRLKGISQNKLYNQYGVSRAQIDRLKHNRPVYTTTLDMLCGILGCDDISDVVTYIPDDKISDSREKDSQRKDSKTDHSESKPS